MKITIECDEGDKFSRSVTVRQNYDLNMKEVAEMFAGACVAYGFLPDTVAEYVYSELLPHKFKLDNIEENEDGAFD